MTAKEVFDVKDNDFYFVVLSNPYEMYNPFLRHYGKPVKTTNYRKPLGIFRTRFAHTNITNEFGAMMLEANIDTTEFDHLYHKGQLNELPDGKHLYDYAEYRSDQLLIKLTKGYIDSLWKPVYEQMFFTEAEAKRYYKKMMDNFKRNMKSYIEHLKQEIENANRNIEYAQKQIDYYENIF